jgi:hypothetical protein
MSSRTTTMAVLVVAVACMLCALPGMGSLDGGVVAGAGGAAAAGGRGLMSEGGVVAAAAPAPGAPPALLSRPVWSPSAAIALAVHASGALSHVVAAGLGVAVLVLLAALFTSAGAGLVASVGAVGAMGRRDCNTGACAPMRWAAAGPRGGGRGPLRP